jgi:hypothetical protein
MDDAVDPPNSEVLTRSDETSGERWSARVFLGVGAVASVFYVVIGRRLWFVNDEWDFLAKRTVGSFRGLFSSHNGHWCTLPILVYRLLWWIVGIRTYVPYLVVIVGLHFVAASLLRKVMLRAGVGPWIATASALALVLFGRGEQDLIWPFQITYVGALVFGLVQLLLADHDGPLDRRDWFALAAGAAALLCSGVAITMIIVVGIATLIRRGVRVAAVHTVPFGLAYVVWLSTEARDAFTGSGTGTSQKIKFVLETPLNAFRAMSSYRGGQFVLAVLLVVGLVLAFRRGTRAAWTTRYAAPFALFIGAGVFLVLTAVGRAGPSGAGFRSRYLDIVLALMLPAFAIAADAIVKRRRAFAVPVFALLLVGVPSNLHSISSFTQQQQKNVAQYRQTVLVLPRLPLSRAVPPAIQPLSGITIGWLLGGVALGRIPKPGPISAVEAETDKLRLSLRPVRKSATSVTPCRALTGPVTVHLAPKHFISVTKGAIRVVPLVGPLDGVYPANFANGVVLTPVSSALTFRVLPANSRKSTRICGPK